MHMPCLPCLARLTTIYSACLPYMHFSGLGLGFGIDACCICLYLCLVPIVGRVGPAFGWTGAGLETGVGLVVKIFATPSSPHPHLTPILPGFLPCRNKTGLGTDLGRRTFCLFPHCLRFPPHLLLTPLGSASSSPSSISRFLCTHALPPSLSQELSGTLGQFLEQQVRPVGGGVLVYACFLPPP